MSSLYSTSTQSISPMCHQNNFTAHVNKVKLDYKSVFTISSHLVYTFRRKQVIYNFSIMASKNNLQSKSSLTSTEIELINRVHSYFQNNDPDKFHFFYATASPFSNFHPCTIMKNGLTFHCNEQYMMYHKASKYLQIKNCYHTFDIF
jgi:hypothetical protein